MLKLLHPRNTFEGTYDMKALVEASPTLVPYIIPAEASRGGRATINFSDPDAVKALNSALLKKDYGVNSWDFPEGKLCPPIPGRADYLHHIADVLGECCSSHLPLGPKVRGFDVGTGASFVYPMLGAGSYGWSFIATECDKTSLDAAVLNLAANSIESNVAALEKLSSPSRRSASPTALLSAGLAASEIRLQSSSTSIFKGVLNQGEEVDFSMCNPPFYESLNAFQLASTRKQVNLKRNSKKRGGNSSARTVSSTNKTQTGSNNFGGGGSELWCPGGEAAFIGAMISGSKSHARERCMWFTSLVSRQEHLPAVRSQLKKVGGVVDTREIKMGQSHKTSTIVMWSFLSEPERRAWAQRRGWACEAK